jgi:hypothetical protein
MRKLGSRICDCDFIGSACNSSCYRFLIIKIDVLDYNIIIESENDIFFEHVFPLEKNKENYSMNLLLLLKKSLIMYKN